MRSQSIARSVSTLLLILTLQACGKKTPDVLTQNAELPPADIAQSLITRVMPPDLMAGGSMKVTGIYSAHGKAWIKAYRVERNGVARENEIYDVAVRKEGGEWKARDPFDAKQSYR